MPCFPEWWSPSRSAFSLIRDQGVVPAAPFRPGAIIDSYVTEAEQFQGQNQSAGTGTGAAGSNDWLRKIYSLLAQTTPKLRLRKDRAVGPDQLGKWKIPAAGQEIGRASC